MDKIYLVYQAHQVGILQTKIISLLTAAPSAVTTMRQFPHRLSKKNNKSCQTNKVETRSFLL